VTVIGGNDFYDPQSPLPAKKLPQSSGKFRMRLAAAVAAGGCGCGCGLRLPACGWRLAAAASSLPSRLLNFSPHKIDTSPPIA
jgi:hypothetical protein